MTLVLENATSSVLELPKKHNYVVFTHARSVAIEIKAVK